MGGMTGWMERDMTMRMKTKLPERLEVALRGLASPKKISYADYCAEVIEVFLCGAAETQRRRTANIPGVVIPESFAAEKCTEELVLYLSDDLAGGVCAMVNSNPSLTTSEVIRWVLTLHVDGFSHVASLMLNVNTVKGQ